MAIEHDPHSFDVIAEPARPVIVRYNLDHLTKLAGIMVVNEQNLAGAIGWTTAVGLDAILTDEDFRVRIQQKRSEL